MTFYCSSAFVTLATQEFESLVQFYHQLFHQTPDLYRPNTYAEFRVSGLRLGIFKPKAERQSEFDQPQHAAMSICLEVNDLEGAIAHLSELGYPPSGDILEASHGREIYAYDPVGNRLILHQSFQSVSTGKRDSL